jgi:hypothetical protein
VICACRPRKSPPQRTPPMHPLRLSSRAFPVLLDGDRTGDAEPEPGVMCVLRGRGTCERPWSNNGWVVVLSVHVPTDPIRSQACGTFVEHSGTFRPCARFRNFWPCARGHPRTPENHRTNQNATGESPDQSDSSWDGHAREISGPYARPMMSAI